MSSIADGRERQLRVDSGLSPIPKKEVPKCIGHCEVSPAGVH